MKTVIPLTDQEKCIWRDIEWAEKNAEIQRQCAGVWVVIHDRTLVAHGLDRDHVVAQASSALSLPEEQLAVWPIFDAASLLDATSQTLVGSIPA